MLNVGFEPQFVDDLVTGCFDSVHIVQEACRSVCVQNDVFETQQSHRVLSSSQSSADVIMSIVDQQSARYDTFLDGFASGFQETSLEMYKWLLLPILSCTDSTLESGLSYGIVRRIIDENHPQRPVNAGNVTQALSAAASLQVRQKITPIIVDYDQSHKRMNVVDRGFLTWLSYQDREAIRVDLGLPRNPTAPDGITLV